MEYYSSITEWNIAICSNMDGFGDYHNMRTKSGRERQILHDITYVVLSHSVMSDSLTSWTVAHQAPLSMGTLQARILESVAMPSSRGSSWPGMEPTSLASRALAGGFFTNCATREALWEPLLSPYEDLQLSIELEK